MNPLKNLKINLKLIKGIQAPKKDSNISKTSVFNTYKKIKYQIGLLK